MINPPDLTGAIVCVIGLGYIGMPLAKAFSRHFKVIGLDIDTEKIEVLKEKHSAQNLHFTDSASDIKTADFLIICVPTPVNKDKKPNLEAIKNAALLVGRNLKRDSIVILESTVYPGVTEEIVKPILEKKSGCICGKDFYLGYSPERINPGDDEHSVERVVKVVAGMDERTTEIIATLYQTITPKVFKARNIKTAEASKVAENVQRDLNIALANELSKIFEKIGLNSWDVFDAAATKWNYHRYKPGMVGGYCIPVVPYYLVHKSKILGYAPQLILAGRKVNNSMPEYVAGLTAEALKSQSKKVDKARVLVLGLTYKENVSESRESPAKELIEKLANYGIEVYTFEPLLAEDIIKNEFGAWPVRRLAELKNTKMDAVIITVPHTPLLKISLDDLKDIQNDFPILIDIPGIFKIEGAKEAGIYYKAL